MVPHTVVVDFAVALLVTSVVCDLLARLAEEDELAAVAHWTLLFGVLAAAFSALSGYAAYATAAPGGVAEQVILRHRNFGLLALSCFTAVSAWRMLSHGRPPPRLQGLYWGLTFVGLGALVTTAYLGGTAVFRHGVGIRLLG